MTRTRAAALAPLLLAAALLAACGGSRPAAEPAEPAVVEHVTATGAVRLHLTAAAAARLGLRTERVRAAAGGTAGRLVLPYAALLYGRNGSTFTYASPAPLVFVRRPVTVLAIEGDAVSLSAGPPVGTAVVTAGAAELRGIEVGVVG